MTASIPATSESSTMTAPNSTNTTNLQTQSTIYKRHQARVLKNMEKPHDPRPAVVRVLSGLPGFRTLVPPYDANDNADVSIKEQQPPILSNTTTTPSTTVQPLHVVLAAGVVGATAEAFYGQPTKSSHPSPFRAAATAANNNNGPLLQGLFKLQAVQQPTVSSWSLCTNKFQLRAGATTAGVLFGTKTVVNNWLSPKDYNVATSLVSSATAGAVLAVVGVLQSTRLLKTPHQFPLPQTHTLPRHVLGATLYFGSYDAIMNMQDNHPKRSVTKAALVGATAGALYQSVLSFQFNNKIPRVHVPTVLKVAPAHALLFVAYEWVQGNL